jgi:hypothetical protein
VPGYRYKKGFYDTDLVLEGDQLTQRRGVLLEELKLDLRQLRPEQKRGLIVDAIHRMGWFLTLLGLLLLVSTGREYTGGESAASLLLSALPILILVGGGLWLLSRAGLWQTGLTLKFPSGEVMVVVDDGSEAFQAFAAAIESTLRSVR